MSFRYPVTLGSSSFCSFPVQHGQYRSDPSGIRGPKAIDAFKIETADGDLKDRCPYPKRAWIGDLTFKKYPDRLLPNIGLVAIGLLDTGVIDLELGIGPPVFARVIGHRRFRQQLVTIALEVLDQNLTAAHRPEPPAAGFIAQIHLLIGCADKHALPRFDHVHTPVRGPVAFDLPGHEHLQQAGLRLRERMQLSDFDQPLPT
jgi:hypothetical protein